MNPSTLNPSPVKDGRHILGEKSTNACLSPAGNRRVDLTPVKRSTLFETGSTPKKLLPSPSIVSRKRSIGQVEGIQINNASMSAQRVPPPPLQESASTQSTTLDSSQPGNDTDAIDSDSYSTPEQKQRGPAQTGQNIPKHSLEPRATVPGDPETRKVFIQEKATLLRTRIQCAMQNIKDDQLDRRLSVLEDHSRKYPRLSFSTSTRAPTFQRKDIQSPLQASTQTPPPANLRPIPEPSNANGLSSPPLSTDNANQGDQMKTPTQNDFRLQAASPVQLSSPPVSDRGNERGDAEGDDDAATEKASTPSEKGDAVDGLLKLMNTGDR